MHVGEEPRRQYSGFEPYGPIILLNVQIFAPTAAILLLLSLLMLRGDTLAKCW